MSPLIGSSNLVLCELNPKSGKADDRTRSAVHSDRLCMRPRVLSVIRVVTHDALQRSDLPEFYAQMESGFVSCSSGLSSLWCVHFIILCTNSTNWKQYVPMHL